ncbi:hypothetical protein [Kordia sp.]|uniref:hypothetical protein n=1 Tax=Kordia sp. TaxID=1965332 RepID=UPI003D29B7C4
MNFLKKIFSFTGKEKFTFPEETSKGNVHIEGTKIICVGTNQMYTCEVNIDALQYAYIIVNRHEKSFLLLFDSHQNQIPTNYGGFKEVYQNLSSQFNFNDKLFFKNVHRSSIVKKRIWRKINASNYKTIEDTHKDYELGFEICAPAKDFINWDSTYDELKVNPNVFFEKSPYNQQLLKFKYPVRIGNIIIENFSSYFDNKRTDVPIVGFFAYSCDETNSDKSYYQLKERLQKDFTEENQLFGYERKDQNSFSFNAKDILISLTYTYDSDFQFDDGHTLFHIENKREYPELLIDEKYESIMEISSTIIINEEVKAVTDYKRNKRVKRRPKKLDTTLSMLWIDAKIGFADQSYCQVFDIDEIEHLTIYNVLPAKGSGGAYLEVNLIDNSRLEVFSGTCYVFDVYKQHIEKLTNLKVKMAPEQDDY